MLKNKVFLFLSQSGNSLIQVMVATAVMSVLALGIASMISTQNKEVKSLSEKLLTKEIETQLKNLISNSDYCNCLLRGKSFNTTPGSLGIVPADQITRIKAGYSTGPSDAVPCTALAEDLIPPAGAALPSSTMAVNSVQIDNMSQIAPANYKADITVVLTGHIRALKPIKTAIQFSIDPLIGTPTNRPFIGCAGSPSAAPLAVRGFCTPAVHWDNSNVLACDPIVGFSVRRLHGVSGGVYRNTSCCYVPDSSGSPGWCSSLHEGWGGSFTGCGASTANYTTFTMNGVTSGVNDTYQCCYIPTVAPANGEYDVFSTERIGANNSWTLNCGGPYSAYHVRYQNAVTGGSGRNISCTWYMK